MRKIFLRNMVALTMVLMLLVPAFSLVMIGEASAQSVTADELWGGSTGPSADEVQTSIGLGNKDPREIVASVIRVIMGFLGIIAVVIILIGGFKWMTAAGGEEKISEAKKLITAGVIGLVIIMASFGIATFVIENVLIATGDGV